MSKTSSSKQRAEFLPCDLHDEKEKHEFVFGAFSELEDEQTCPR